MFPLNAAATAELFALLQQHLAAIYGAETASLAVLAGNINEPRRDTKVKQVINLRVPSRFVSSAVLR